MAILERHPKHPDKFRTGDAVTAAVINDTIDTAINAREVALGVEQVARDLVKPPDVTLASQVGEPKVEVTGDGRLKFISIKGDKGEKGNKGDKGDSAIIVWGDNAPSAVSTVEWTLK